MKRKMMVLKVAAVVSSVGLVATYVACKSMNAGKANESGTAAAGELGDQGADDQNKVKEEGQAGQAEFFGGSKSRAVFTPPPQDKPRPHMGGSKSLAPILAPSDLKKQQPAEQPAQQPK